MAKQLIYGEDARKALQRGIDQLADERNAKLLNWLPEAPEGSGVGLCLLRNRNMKMHQAASRQQPGTQQG